MNCESVVFHTSPQRPEKIVHISREWTGASVYTVQRVIYLNLSKHLRYLSSNDGWKLLPRSQLHHIHWEAAKGALTFQFFDAWKKLKTNPLYSQSSFVVSSKVQHYSFIST